MILKKIFPLILLIALVFPNFVLACSPLDGDNWFNETYQFETSSLPPKMEIEEKINVNSGDKYYLLTNYSTSPLYLFRDFGFYDNKNNREFPYNELPSKLDKYYLVSKLQNGNNFHWGILDPRNPDNSEYGWKVNEGEYSKGANLVNIVSYNLGDASHQVYRDNRPKDIEIPNPQDFEILAYYQGQEIIINGTVGYSLNTDYDSTQSSRSCAYWGTTSPIENIIIIALVSLVAIVLLAIPFFLYKKLRKYFFNSKPSGYA